MNLEKHTKKLVGNDEERAVSPVIGVILMVAITVILAAVIAAFVLDLGQSTSANPQAGFQVEQTDTDEYEVTLTSIERLDSWGADCGSTPSATANDPAEVGQSETLGSCSDPDNIEIIGAYNGEEAVLR